MSVFRIKNVCPIDDAGSVHYETVMTSGLIVDSVKDKTIVFKDNIRPDFDGNGKMMPKTKRKVERWAREILEGTAALGNLSIRLDPSIQFELIEYEDGRLDMDIHFKDDEALDTAVDSQSRLESMVLAEKKNPTLFDRKKRNSVRVWVAPIKKAHEIAVVYNTRGDRVNDSAAKSKFAATNLEKVVEYLVKSSGNPHLSSNNIEVLSNTVSGGSPKLVGYNTLVLALNQEWKSEPITQQQIELMGKFISDSWTKLVAVRPEFGVVPITDRQGYRKTSLAGTALSIYGVIGVIHAGYAKKLNIDEMDAYLEKFAADSTGDWLSVKNPLWQSAGVIVPATLKELDVDGNPVISLKTRNTFQTRQETAKQFKAHIGLI